MDRTEEIEINKARLALAGVTLERIQDEYETAVIELEERFSKTDSLKGLESYELQQVVCSELAEDLAAAAYVCELYAGAIARMIDDSLPVRKLSHFANQES